MVHKTLNPVWLEQFDLHLYEDPYLGQELEVTVSMLCAGILNGREILLSRNGIEGKKLFECYSRIRRGGGEKEILQRKLLTAKKIANESAPLIDHVICWN